MFRFTTADLLLHLPRAAGSVLLVLEMSLDRLRAEEDAVVLEVPGTTLAPSTTPRETP